MADSGYNFALYRYTPSLPAAIVAAVVFAVLTAAHLGRLLRKRTLYFIPFTIGGVFEMVGYCGRIWSHFDTTSIGAFVIQAILILVAPALYAASIYMVLGRLITTMHAEKLSLIPVRRLTKIFVIGDVCSFMLQAGGGGIQSAGTLQLYDIGEKIIVAGLFMQIVFFGLFVTTSVIFHCRAAKAAQRHPDLFSMVPWQRYLAVLYTASGLILVRSIFRVVEYLQGNSGYLISHEVFLYCFDAVLMALTMTVILIWYVDGLQPLSKAQTRQSMESGEVMLPPTTWAQR